MIQVHPVVLDDPDVLGLLDALTSELGAAGYTAAQTFGYTAEQLHRSNVHMVGAQVDGELVGIGGLELQGDRVGELKRFFVRRERRGTGVASAILNVLLDHARAHQLELVRLETGDKQHAAMAFYRRHGFVDIPPFGPYLTSQTSVCMQRSIGP